MLLQIAEQALRKPAFLTRGMTLLFRWHPRNYLRHNSAQFGAASNAEQQPTCAGTSTRCSKATPQPYQADAKPRNNQTGENPRHSQASLFARHGSRFMRHAASVRRSASYATRHAPCAMPTAMRHAPDAMLRAPRVMRHALYATRCASLTSCVMAWHVIAWHGMV